MSVKSRLVFNKKTIIIASAIVVVIISFIAVTVAINTHKATNSNGNNESADSPDYQTILPNGESINKLSGWTRISPPGKDPVYAYVDKIGSTPITVSEQPVPASFKDNIDTQVAQLAKAYSATDQLDASGTKVYIGTSVKGPQSVIFEMDGLLILMKSQQKVADNDWIKYIQSLTITNPVSKF